METIERISIYIDGGNFYHLVLKKLDLKENDFDFEEFAKMLFNGRDNIDCQKRFYKGTIREKEGDEQSKKLMSDQNRFFSYLKSNNWDLNTSKLVTRTEELTIDDRVKEHKELKKLKIDKIHYERMREKGIDVKLSIDLLVGAFDDKYDLAIVVTSDTDIIPAIDWVRNRTKKKIEYIGFSIQDEQSPEKSTRPLKTMFYKTDVQRVFSDVDMRKFIKTPPEDLFSNIN